MGKGSRPRPTNKTAFKSNFDAIEWSGNYHYLGKQRPERRAKVHHVMPDIAPYRAVAGDMAGKEISSRSKHREFLRRNNFEEVGNEKQYFMRHGGMTPDNPWVDFDKKPLDLD